MGLEAKIKQHQYEVDAENNQLTFYDTRFYRAANGQFYPSVSSILECWPKDAQFFEWLKREGENADQIRDEAGGVGSTVHKLTELYDNGEEVSLRDINGDIKFKIREWAFFERYVEFTRRFAPKIYYNEMNYVCEKLGFGMTLDRVMDVAGKKLVVDIKTSNSLNDSYWAQLYAYKKGFEDKHPEEPVDGVAILHLNALTRTEGKKGDIQGIGWRMTFPDETEEYYWGLFLDAQNFYNHKYKNLKPKNISYKLTHKK